MAMPPAPIYQRNVTTFDNLAHTIVLGRRLIMVRHGERTDRCFGKNMVDWLHRTWPNKSSGIYCRVNMNFPRRCPLRGEKKDDFNILDYKSDAPLTTIGEGTAERLGSRLYGSNLKITRVFCSPALRCMQTCNRVLQGFCEASGQPNLKRSLPMNIEPAIYDFTGFAENQLMVPTMLNADFMIDRHFFINKDYKPVMTVESLEPGEEIEDFTKRIEKAVEKILNEIQPEQHGSFLVVTHGPVMDAICQNLLEQPPRSYGMFPKVANYPPYLATMVMEENTNQNVPLKWRLAPPPVKSFTLLANNHTPMFDWKKMTERR